MSKRRRVPKLTFCGKNALRVAEARQKRDS